MWQVGDMVEPRPEWKDDPNQIPTGQIVKIEKFGKCGAIYVEGERRAFAGYVFQIPTDQRRVIDHEDTAAIRDLSASD